MDVHAAESGQIQNHLRQDEPIGHHHQHVGAPGFEGEALVCPSEAAGLRDGQPQGLRGHLHRARRGVPAAPLRPIRLGEHSDQLVG